MTRRRKFSTQSMRLWSASSKASTLLYLLSTSHETQWADWRRQDLHYNWELSLKQLWLRLLQVDFVEWRERHSATFLGADLWLAEETSQQSHHYQFLRDLQWTHLRFAFQQPRTPVDTRGAEWRDIDCRTVGRVGAEHEGSSELLGWGHQCTTLLK